jgi:hypothetical protein
MVGWSSTCSKLSVWIRESNGVIGPGSGAHADSCTHKGSVGAADFMVRRRMGPLYQPNSFSKSGSKTRRGIYSIRMSG